MNETRSIGERVKFTGTRYKQTLNMQGVIKDIRKRFGRTEFLVDEVTAEPFWIRSVEDVE